MIGMFDHIDKMSNINNVNDLKHVFLGNYVNFGEYGCEVLSYLLAMKINRPENFYLLRGNHET